MGEKGGKMADRGLATLTRERRQARRRKIGARMSAILQVGGRNAEEMNKSDGENAQDSWVKCNNIARLTRVE